MLRVWCFSLHPPLHNPDQIILQNVPPDKISSPELSTCVPEIGIKCRMWLNAASSIGGGVGKKKRGREMKSEILTTVRR